MNKLLQYLKNKTSEYSWIHFVSTRFSKVDRKGGSAVTTTLASLGICFGVMTLITVISVMNGFQRSFIDAILEVSSYHIRISDIPDENLYDVDYFCKSNSFTVYGNPFYEAQSLVTGKTGRQSAALIRAVPSDIYVADAGLKKELKIIGGNFDISSPDSIVIGSELARKLGVRLGSEINLYALSGGNDVDLFSSNRVFTVTGIFHTGYAEINAAYAFCSLESGKKYFGKDSKLIYGIKLQNPDHYAGTVTKMKQLFPECTIQSWNDYNRGFFGALRVEKNMLMLLVFLIFVVVAINIYNGMRRMVYERKEEISVLSAFGGNPADIQSIFITQGVLTGIYGAIPGLLLGLLISINMGRIFVFLSKITYYINLFFTMLITPQNAGFVRENTMFIVYSSIPSRIYVSEVLVITIFGIFSSLIASWSASRGILKMTIAEVMRDE